MDWLKRNTTLLVGALVALVLLGAAGYYLYSQIQRNEAISQKLQQRRDKWQSLVGNDPYPDEANIKAARKDAQRVNAFLGKVRAQFGRPRSLEVTNSSQFKSLLETTLAELRNKARRYGVRLPRNQYHFTFEPQSTMVQFKTNNIPALASQLADIEAICEVLFKPRIHELVQIRRVPISDQDMGRNQFISRSIETNQVAVVAPYTVTFKGFNAEFSNVVKGLTKAKECFLVKQVSVNRSKFGPQMQGPSQQELGRGVQQSRRSSSRQQETSANEQFKRRYGVSPGGGSSDNMQDAYGESYGGGQSSRQREIQRAYQRQRRSATSGSGYGRGGGQSGQLPQGDPMSNLKPKPLEVTLLIQVVKLKPQEEE